MLNNGAHVVPALRTLDSILRRMESHQYKKMALYRPLAFRLPQRVYDRRMRQHPRYRAESDMHAIDVRIASVDQLFDNRDPAPFRERDLDPDLVDYLVDAAEDVARYGPFRIVLWCGATPKADGVEPAFRAHFQYELDRMARYGRRRRAIGAVALVVGIAILLVLQTLAQVVPQNVGGVAAAAREGLVIFSWVVLWRPVDAYVYDWIPARRRRRIITQLLDAPIDVRSSPARDDA